MTEQQMALLKSCTPNEACLFLDGELVKLPNSVISAMHIEALERAMKSALDSLGAPHRIVSNESADRPGHRLILEDGFAMRHFESRIEIECSEVVFTVELTDGRTGEGRAQMRRPTWQ